MADDTQSLVTCCVCGAAFELVERGHHVLVRDGGSAVCEPCAEAVHEAYLQSFEPPPRKQRADSNA